MSTSQSRDIFDLIESFENVSWKIKGIKISNFQKLWRNLKK